MKRLVQSICVIALAAVVAMPAVASEKAKAEPNSKAKTEKKAEKKPGKQAQPKKDRDLLAGVTRGLKKVELTEKQQQQIESLKQKYAGKATDLANKANLESLPREAKARKEAIAKAKAAGKKGPELKAAVAEAVKVSPQQQEARQELGKLIKDVRTEVVNVLTEEQRKSLGGPKVDGGKRKSGEKKKQTEKK